MLKDLFDFFLKTPEGLRLITLIGALFILGYAISQARRVTNDVMNNIDKLGVNDSAKRSVAYKTIFNFYMVVVITVIIVVASLRLIGTELFIALLISILMAMGIKLTLDIREK